MPAMIKKFRVELDKLQQTAESLQAEVDALRGSAEGMAGSPNFGDANIAGVARLGARHQQIIGPTQQLISDIRGGIAAGQEALRAVAARYAEADNAGAEKLDRAAEEKLEDEGFEQDPEYRGNVHAV